MQQHLPLGGDLREGTRYVKPVDTIQPVQQRTHADRAGNARCRTHSTAHSAFLQYAIEHLNRLKLRRILELQEHIRQFNRVPFDHVDS